MNLTSDFSHLILCVYMLLALANETKNALYSLCIRYVEYVATLVAAVMKYRRSSNTFVTISVKELFSQSLYQNLRP